MTLTPIVRPETRLHHFVTATEWFQDILDQMRADNRYWPVLPYWIERMLNDHAELTARVAELEAQR